MESTLWLRYELDLYNNPFKLLFSISGTEAEKNCSVLISFKDEDRFGEIFYQGEPFATKAETVKNLGTTLRITLFNCEKVSTVVDNIGPGNGGRYLTLAMVEEIISTLSEDDIWMVCTGTKKWKKKFLIKEDGLVEGQKVTLKYLSGQKKDEIVQGVLDAPIKINYLIAFEGVLKEANPVEDLEEKSDGSFIITTKDFTCMITINE